VELPQRDFDCPLILAKVPQGIDSEIEELADTRSGCPQEEQTVRAQVIVFSELLLELMVILGGKRLGEVLIDRGAISSNQETFSHPTVARGQIVKQPAN